MPVTILLTVLLLGLYVLNRSGHKTPAQPTQPDTAAGLMPDHEGQAEALAGEPEPAAEDDLTRIWGLGENVAERLKAAGVVTFRQVAALTEAQLMELVGGQRMKIETWPEQARLAAAGDWQGLEALISKL